MVWSHPWILLIGTALLATAFLRKYLPSSSLRYSSLVLLKHSDNKKIVRQMIAILPLLGCICLIIAVAEPKMPDLKTRVTAEGLNIVVLFDNSSSMEEPDFAWKDQEKISRKEAAKRVLMLFITGGSDNSAKQFSGRSTERGTDRIGLITFSNWPQTICPPTANHQTLRKLLENLPDADARDTATNIGDSVAEGVQRVTTSSGEKILILISDGEHNFDLADSGRKPLLPRQAATIASHYGVKVYCIDTAPIDSTVEGGNDRTSAREILQETAALTGGSYFRAGNGTELSSAMQELDQLEKQPYKAPVYRKYHSYRPICLYSALIIFLGWLVSICTRYRTFP
ncbi:MAG: VWA domain-containing protein [Zavarzinella sp.]